MKALVVGSAHLDILGRPSTVSSHKDREGSVTFEVGGTACNVAFGLRKIGADVRLLTAWGDDDISKLLAGKVRSAHVDLLADEVPGMPVAAFHGQLTVDGDLQSAVSAMPIGQYRFSSARIAEALEGIGYVIVDANLHPGAIADVAAAARAKSIPVFGLGVSEDKVERLLAGKGLFTAAFMNHAECERLMACLNAVDPTAVAEAFNASLFVTRGARGAVVYKSDGDLVRIPPPQLTDIKTLLGVGDAFSAGVIDAMVRDRLDFYEAAARAEHIVREIATREACNAYSVNALSQMVKGLYQVANTDSLTGLLKRHAFEEAFSSVAMAQHTLLFIDCDHFKRVNDTIGHDAGDAVLQRIASIIRESVRSSGDVVARWGGDEFVVLLTSSDTRSAHAVAERMRDAAQQADLQGVTLSIGLTPTVPGEPLTSAVGRADTAMYTAKHSGKNSVAVAG